MMELETHYRSPLIKYYIDVDKPQKKFKYKYTILLLAITYRYRLYQRSGSQTLLGHTSPK